MEFVQKQKRRASFTNLSHIAHRLSFIVHRSSLSFILFVWFAFVLWWLKVESRCEFGSEFIFYFHLKNIFAYYVIRDTVHSVRAMLHSFVCICVEC